MKKLKKSTGLTVALLILCFCYRGVFPAAQYGNQQYGEIYNRNCFVCQYLCCGWCFVKRRVAA